MGVRARGVQDIKTLAAVRGTGIHSNERHVQQFKVASLELERLRRTRERQAALRRITDIDARLREIDELFRRHYEALGLAADNAIREHHAPGAGDVPRGSGRRRTLRY